MSKIRTAFAASWLFWGAVFPVIAGIMLAIALEFDIGLGALLGGLVAIPLSIWGVRLADREAERSRSESIPNPEATPTPAGEQAEGWNVEALLVGLAALAMGLFGLIRGTTVVAVPGGTQPNQRLSWIVSGPWATVAACGLIIFGVGWLMQSRPGARDERWPLRLVVGGFLILVTGSLVARFTN